MELTEQERELIFELLTEYELTMCGFKGYPLVKELVNELYTKLETQE